MADKTTRHEHLGEILLDRRRELADDLRRRIRDGRADRAILLCGSGAGAWCSSTLNTTR